MFVPNLVAGTTYFVRLYTHRGGFWYSTDTSFLAGNALATLTNPQDGALISPLAVFSWSVPDFPVDAYYLIIGSTPAARDVYESGSLQETSVTPAGLEVGNTYYARLCPIKGGFWRPTQSTLTKLPQPV